jgi:hypothetical protein
MGEPDKYYVPIEIVETTTTGTIGVQSYLFGVLKKEAKEMGGDGFILLSKDASIGGSVSTGSIYGSISQGSAYATSTTLSVPIKYNTYRAVIFRYASEQEIGKYSDVEIPRK